MSHDVSRDLKDVAVRVLCKAVEEFTSSYDEVYITIITLLMKKVLDGD